MCLRNDRGIACGKAGMHKRHMVTQRNEEARIERRATAQDFATWQPVKAQQTL